MIVRVAPSHFIHAICALIEFCYFSQVPVIPEAIQKNIIDALQEFHDNKHIIIELGAHHGKKGDVIKHWQIPKLELMQSIVPSIAEVGSLLQWSADIMEHAHIRLIKNPAEASNNKDYDSQICCYLDRHEKCCLSNDMTTLMLAKSCDGDMDTESEDLQEMDHDTIDVLEASHPAAILSALWGPNHQLTNFFNKFKCDAREDTLKNHPPIHLLGVLLLFISIMTLSANKFPSMRQLSYFFFLTCIVCLQTISVSPLSISNTYSSGSQYNCTKHPVTTF